MPYLPWLWDRVNSLRRVSDAEATTTREMNDVEFCQSQIFETFVKAVKTVFVHDSECTYHSRQISWNPVPLLYHIPQWDRVLSPLLGNEFLSGTIFGTPLLFQTQIEKWSDFELSQTKKVEGIFRHYFTTDTRRYFPVLWRRRLRKTHLDRSFWVFLQCLWCAKM